MIILFIHFPLYFSFVVNLDLDYDFLFSLRQPLFFTLFTTHTSSVFSLCFSPLQSFVTLLLSKESLLCLLSLPKILLNCGVELMPYEEMSYAKTVCKADLPN